LIVKLYLPNMTIKMNKTILFILLLTVMSSCIPTKKIIYLQDKEGKKSEVTLNQSNIKPYRLQSQDIISIILKAPDEKIVEMFKTNATSGGETQQSLYFNGFTVDDKGEIRIPVLGKVKVLGMTLEEVRLELERLLLRDYFKEDAQIFVDVKLPGIVYTMNGEIGNPGPNVVYKDKVTLLEAVANSGDILVTGDREDIMIIRQYPHGTEIHKIDLTSLEAMNSPYYYIQPNDYIYIKPLKQKTWGTGVTGLQTMSTIFQVVSIFSTILLLSTRF
jgi:polysaccharide export outer membrane protein